MRLNSSTSSGSIAHAWNVSIGAHSASLMQRSIWFARTRHFPDNLSAESARVACPSCKTSQPIPASHFPARRGWSKLSRGLREAGVACLSIAASRPKLHVQQHSPLNRRIARCWVARDLERTVDIFGGEQPRMWWTTISRRVKTSSMPHQSQQRHISTKLIHAKERFPCHGHVAIHADDRS